MSKRFFLVLTLVFVVLDARAEEVANPAPIEPVAAPKDSSLREAAEAEEDAPSSARKKGRVKRFREKEAEGTQAPNRFEADTVIKSQYQLDGQPLEVDPD